MQMLMLSPTFSLLLLLLLARPTASTRTRFLSRHDHHHSHHRSTQHLLLPITFQNNLASVSHTPVVASEPNLGKNAYLPSAGSGPNPGGNSQILAAGGGPNPGGNAHVLAAYLPSAGSGPNPGGNSQILAAGGGPNPGGNAHVLAAGSGPNPGGNMVSLAARSGANTGGNDHILAVGSGPNPGGNMENLAATSGPNPGGNAEIDTLTQFQSSSDSKHYQAVIKTTRTSSLSAESTPNPTKVNKDESSEETMLLEGQLPKGPVPPSGPSPGINSNIPQYYQEVTFSKLPKGPVSPSGPSHSGNEISLGESLHGHRLTEKSFVPSKFLADPRTESEKQERSGHGNEDDVIACAEDQAVLLCKHEIDPFQHDMIFKDDGAEMGFGVAAARSIGL